MGFSINWLLTDLYALKSNKGENSGWISCRPFDHSMVCMPQNYVGMVQWKLYFDGSSHKNGAGIGGIIISPSGIPAEFKYIIEGVCTNNEAEYESLITWLELLL